MTPQDKKDIEDMNLQFTIDLAELAMESVRQHNHALGFGAGGEISCPCGAWWIILRRPSEDGRVFICPDCQDWHSILFR